MDRGQDLIEKGKLTDEDLQLVKSVFLDMKKKVCDQCGLKGHSRAFCWINMQIQTSVSQLTGPISDHWEFYKQTLLAEEQQELVRRQLNAMVEARASEEALRADYNIGNKRPRFS